MYPYVTESTWRIMGFDMHAMRPTICRLAIHDKDEQNVTFRNNQNLQEVVMAARNKDTTLTGWFNANTRYPQFRDKLYTDYCEVATWDKKEGMWFERRVAHRHGIAPIGRMYFVSPVAGERYFLRILLTHVKGAESFEAMREFEGVQYSSYKEAAVARGLLQDDHEWDQTRCIVCPHHTMFFVSVV
jgi:hypothetical protein